jgi:hypothetical protein
MAGIAFPPDRIFSQTVSGLPKSEVLESLRERHPGAQAYVFVEDKLSTLEKVGAASGGGYAGLASQSSARRSEWEGRPEAGAAQLITGQRWIKGPRCTSWPRAGVVLPKPS